MSGFLHNKGFSLVEVLVSFFSLGALGLLVHSMLLLGHSFTKSNQNELNLLQVQKLFSDTICEKSNKFKQINIKKTLSFADSLESMIGTSLNPNQSITTTTQKYMQLNSNNIGQEPLLSVDIKGLSTSNRDNIVEDNNNAPVFYNTYQDSHTILILDIDFDNIGSMSGTVVYPFESGYILASRCVKKASSSLSLDDNDMPFTFNPKDKKKAFYEIIENQYKPFYFVTEDKIIDNASTTGNPASTITQKGGVIKCCKVLNTTSTIKEQDCEDQNNVQEFVPRMYVMSIQPIDNLSTLDVICAQHFSVPGKTGSACEDYIKTKIESSFLVKIEHIQEIPEMQDINSLWGAGFMLSLETKKKISGAPFNIDIMFLKNTCITSMNFINNCPDLSFVTDFTQPLLGVENTANLTVKDFIVSSVNHCAGYSHGVETGSLIYF